MVIGCAGLHVVEGTREEPAIVLARVEPSHHFGADVVVVSGKVEAGRFRSFRRRDERLRCEQMRLDESELPSGGGNTNPWLLSNGSPDDRAESRVPHERRIERRVDHHRRPALVARPASPWPDDAVVVDADGDRLRIAKAVRRRMTAARRCCRCSARGSDRTTACVRCRRAVRRRGAQAATPTWPRCGR